MQKRLECQAAKVNCRRADYEKIPVYTHHIPLSRTRSITHTPNRATRAYAHTRTRTRGGWGCEQDIQYISRTRTRTHAHVRTHMQRYEPALCIRANGGKFFLPVSPPPHTQDGHFLCYHCHPSLFLDPPGWVVLGLRPQDSLVHLCRVRLVVQGIR